jgi:hypothetical protein
MAQPKSVYTFSSTREECDLLRIVNENPESSVIVLSRKAPCPTITIVTEYRERVRLQNAGHNALAYHPTAEFAVYAGDVHGIALGLIETKVEAY